MDINLADLKAYNNGARYYFDCSGMGVEGERDVRHYYKTNKFNNGHIAEMAHFLPHYGKIVYMDCIRYVADEISLLEKMKKLEKPLDKQ